MSLDVSAASPDGSMSLGISRYSPGADLRLAENLARAADAFNQAETTTATAERIVAAATKVVGCAGAIVALLAHRGVLTVIAGTDGIIAGQLQAIACAERHGLLVATLRAGHDLRIADLDGQQSAPDIARLRAETPVRALVAYPHR